MLAAALAAGCGGDAGEDAARPTLPAALAEDLALRADAVATHLDLGDACSAAAEADELVHATVRAIQDGRVPAELQEPLLSSAQELLHRIECRPAPPPEPPPPAPAETETEPQEEDDAEEREDEDDEEDEDDMDDEDDEEDDEEDEGNGDDGGNG